MQVLPYVVYSLKREIVKQIISYQGSELNLDRIVFVTNKRFYPGCGQSCLENGLYIKPFAIGCLKTRKKSLSDDIAELFMLEEITPSIEGMYISGKEHYLPLEITLNPDKLRNSYSEYATCVKSKVVELIKDEILAFESEIGAKVDEFIKQLEATL